MTYMLSFIIFALFCLLAFKIMIKMDKEKTEKDYQRRQEKIVKNYTDGARTSKRKK